MKWMTQATRRRDWLGAGLALLAAVALLFFLGRIATVSSQAGSDRDPLSRERAALVVARAMTPGLVALVRFRSQTGLGDLRDARRQEAQISASVVTIGRIISTGDAAQMDLTAKWHGVSLDWAKALAVRGKARMTDLNKMVFDWITVDSKIQDASGLTYDTSRFAQNIADATLNSQPANIAAAERSRMEALLAIRAGTMKLANRLTFATRLDTIQGLANLSPDDVVPTLTKYKRRNPALIPTIDRAIKLVHAYEREAKSFSDILSFGVVLKEKPNLVPRTLDLATARMHSVTIATFNVLTEILDAQLVDRLHLREQRDRLILGAVFAAIALVAGLMLLLTQIAARRSYRALIDAQRESERLTEQLARQRAEEALRLSEAQFRAIFERALIGIAILDANGKIVDANPVFRVFFGDSSEALTADRQSEFRELMLGERDGFEAEIHVLTPTGNEAWIATSLSLVRDEDAKPRFAVCTFRDLTALRANERRMLHDKTHDALTGLANRTEFEEVLRRRFADADALLESFYAVLIVDLDRFKDVNESLGHSAGDFVLTQISQRLRGAVDQQDLVARLGGDEFAILVRALGDVLHVETVARRIVAALARPIVVRERSIFISACVGIAVASSRYERAEDVMRDADIAMQHAKTGGGGKYEIFDSGMRTRAQRRLARSSDLHLALERSEFRLLYQPIVELLTGKLVGCEALLRWDHPVEGLLAPPEFMALAEQTGLAPPIGRYVVNAACEQIERWKLAFGGALPFVVNVNVSVTELNDPDFARILGETVQRHHVLASELALEITENVVLDRRSRANAMLERVRQAGFPIVIDDFGTGYSSLRYLQQFPVDTIKIDRGFVSGTDGNLASEPIVRTLMALAEDFQVRVVAEGIETARQREQLREMGCAFGQGFLYSRPVEAVRVEELFPDMFSRMTGAKA